MISTQHAAVDTHGALAADPYAQTAVGRLRPAHHARPVLLVTPIGVVPVALSEVASGTQRLKVVEGRRPTSGQGDDVIHMQGEFWGSFAI